MNKKKKFHFKYKMKFNNNLLIMKKKIINKNLFYYKN